MRSRKIEVDSSVISYYTNKIQQKKFQSHYLDNQLQNKIEFTNCTIEQQMEETFDFRKLEKKLTADLESNAPMVLFKINRKINDPDEKESEQ